LYIFIQVDVEYINIEGATCPCDRGIMYLIKIILENIHVTGASFLGNGRINYINDTRTN